MWNRTESEIGCKTYTWSSSCWTSLEISLFWNESFLTYFEYFDRAVDRFIKRRDQIYITIECFSLFRNAIESFKHLFWIHRISWFSINFKVWFNCEIFFFLLMTTFQIVFNLAIVYLSVMLDRIIINIKLITYRFTIYLLWKLWQFRIILCMIYTTLFYFSWF